MKGIDRSCDENGLTFPGWSSHARPPVPRPVEQTNQPCGHQSDSGTASIQATVSERDDQLLTESCVNPRWRTAMWPEARTMTAHPAIPREMLTRSTPRRNSPGLGDIGLKESQVGSATLVSRHSGKKVRHPGRNRHSGRVRHPGKPPFW